jgi:hypothetical protein
MEGVELVGVNGDQLAAEDALQTLGKGQGVAPSLAAVDANHDGVEHGRSVALAIGFAPGSGATPDRRPPPWALHP